MRMYVSVGIGSKCLTVYDLWQFKVLGSIAYSMSCTRGKIGVHNIFVNPEGTAETTSNRISSGWI